MCKYLHFDAFISDEQALERRAIHMPEDEDEPPPVVRAEQSTVTEQTTLVPNEAEAFALEPLDITTMGMLA